MIARTDALAHLRHAQLRGIKFRRQGWAATGLSLVRPDRTPPIVSRAARFPTARPVLVLDATLKYCRGVVICWAIREVVHVAVPGVAAISGGGLDSAGGRVATLAGRCVQGSVWVVDSAKATRAEASGGGAGGVISGTGVARLGVSFAPREGRGVRSVALRVGAERGRGQQQQQQQQDPAQLNLRAVLEREPYYLQ